MAKVRRPRAQSRPKTKVELERALKRAEERAQREVVARKRADAERDGLRARLEELVEQQTATAHILEVISNSPTDVQPVLDVVAENAARVCGATDAVIHRIEGQHMHRVAHFGSLDPGRAMARSIDRTTAAGRAAVDRQTIHVADMRNDATAAEFPVGAQLARQFGHGTILAAPLMRDGIAIGVILIRRMEVRPFLDEQIALLKTFADQAVIAIENVRLFKELERKNHALTEALDQQTATSEILHVIASSPTDYQPVFETIVRTAGVVCGAVDAVLWTIDGDDLIIRAHYGPLPGDMGFRQPIHGSVAGWAVHNAGVAHVEDLTVADDFPFGRDLARRLGWRTTLSAPLLREGAAIGALLIRRDEVRPFSDQQIELLKTFADQAVIAIENVRLFTELQARNRDLTEALDRQTASAEILRAISQSQTDVQPVFDAIVRNAVQLCGASHGDVYRFDGELIHAVANEGFSDTELEEWRRTWPVPVTSEGLAARAVQAGRIVNVADVEAPGEIEIPEARRANLRSRGTRSVLTVPMFRRGEVIGAISLAHRDVAAFSDAHVELLKTFADQAVIAIENARLLNELQERNRAVTEALEQQTATSEILGVISSSPTDTQPVFDAIVRSAVSLCDGLLGTVLRVDGDRLDLVAHYNVSREGVQAYRDVYPMPIGRETVAGNAILDRRILHVVDAQDEATVPPRSVALARAAGFRAVVAVPLLRAGEPIGLINVARRDRGPFSDRQIELIQTFANQAVIAIENARLFTELQSRTNELTRSVEELRALREVGQAVSSTLDLDTVLDTIAARATELSAAQSGLIYGYDETRTEFHLRAAHRLDEEIVAAIRAAPLRLGEGVAGKAAAIRGPVQVADVLDEQTFDVARIRTIMERRGLRSLLAVPLLLEQRIIGALLVIRREPGSFAPEVVSLLQTFASQSVLAIENARLFQELDQKSRELEAASQHKSEFLANMSHELRTPLNAVIGFSDVLLEGMFGEINEKQTEYLRDILGSGTHLLSLINDILDLSKIEAGRMELDLIDFDVPSAIGNALTLMRERASRHGIALSHVVDDGLGEIRADERKFKQVLLNLLSNAVKFTASGGKVEVRARRVDDMVEVAVADTGEGIAPGDQQAVFEEFRQVGKASKKVEGTGLGLALCRKFVELHGGTIGLESQVGVGSTFTFSVPVRSRSDG